jgi:hypothetical protein
MIQSGLRRAAAASAAQAGDGDWIINHPCLLAGRRSRIESEMPQDTLIQGRVCILKREMAFYLPREDPGTNKKGIFSVTSVSPW